jgi:hypothetical protein
METTHWAVTCRWAVPTAFLPPPFWFDAESSPWTCTHGSAPSVLCTTETCACCSCWQPWEAGGAGKAARARAVGQPSAIDWFGAFPISHEMIEPAPPS